MVVQTRRSAAGGSGNREKSTTTTTTTTKTPKALGKASGKASGSFLGDLYVDVQAGLTLSLVSVPTSVAYASLAGLPGIRGLTKLGLSYGAVRLTLPILPRPFLPSLGLTLPIISCRYGAVRFTLLLASLGLSVHLALVRKVGDDLIVG